jgi:hypothetical protein
MTTLARNVALSVHAAITLKIRLPWVLHVALMLIAFPGLIAATWEQSSYETLHGVYAGPISILLPPAKPFFDHVFLSLRMSYPDSPSIKEVLSHQPVYRLWWLVVQVAFTTVAYSSALDIIA